MAGVGCLGVLDKARLFLAEGGLGGLGGGVDTFFFFVFFGTFLDDDHNRSYSRRIIHIFLLQ